MKKLIAFLLAMCLLAAVLPMAALADDPLPTDQVQVKLRYAAKKVTTLTIKENAPAYVAVKEDGSYGKWTEAEAPADKFVKLEFTQEPASLKVTFHNFNVDSTLVGNEGYTNHTFEFIAGGMPYDVNVELVGENSMIQTKSATMKFLNQGKVNFTGAGSIALTINGAASGAIWSVAGDLSIKDTTMKFVADPNANAYHHAICVGSGSVIIENAKITSNTERGAFIWMGTTDIKEGRSNLTDDANRTITVKNSELDITTENGYCFAAPTGVKISNSTLKLTKTKSTGTILNHEPVFEGEYTAIAGLAANANNLSKLKVFDAKKLTSYTYIYIVPGIQDLLPTEAPTEPEATEPEATDPATPEATEPEETIPPVVTVPTGPAATTPSATTPEASTPSATNPVEDDADEKTPDDTKDKAEKGPMSPVAIIAITCGVLFVLTGGSVGVLFILKKKGIVK